MRRPAALLALFAILLPSLAAQGRGAGICEHDMAVNVLLSDGRLIRGLGQNDLVARVRKRSTAISSLTYSTEPRQILVVLDNHHRLPAAVWELETSLLQHVLQNARQQDRFALITARGAPLSLSFDAGREAIRDAVKGLRSSPLEGAGGLGVLDALQHGVQSFGRRQGDAVLLIAANSDPDLATYRSVLRELRSRGVRLFTFYMAAVSAGTYSTAVTRSPGGGLQFDTAFFADRESIGFLTQDSGGFIFIEPTDHPWRTYSLDKERLELLKQVAFRMYGAIGEHYRVRVTGASGQPVDLELPEALRQRVPNAVLFYPRHLPPCGTAEGT